MSTAARSLNLDLGASPSWTLNDLLAVLARDQLADRDPRTIAEYRSTLGHWRRLTRDPPLAQLSQEDLRAFRAGLLDAAAESDRLAAAGDPQLFLFDVFPDAQRRRRPILSRATVNKHLRHLRAILKLAGPPGPRNEDGLGVIGWVPWVKSVRTARPRPRPPRDATLAAIYRAAETAVEPSVEGVAAAAWWRALILAAVTTGFRREGLLSLLWDDVDWQGRVVFLPAAHDKTNVDRIKPLHSELLKHLLKIRSADRRIFPWDRCAKTFDRHWHKIQRAAGVQPPVKFHSLKSYAGSRLAAGGANVWQVQSLLDHGSLSTSRYYVDASVEDLRAAVERMPLPDFDEEGERRPDAGAG